MVKIIFLIEYEPPQKNEKIEKNNLKNETKKMKYKNLANIFLAEFNKKVRKQGYEIKPNNSFVIEKIVICDEEEKETTKICKTKPCAWCHHLSIDLWLIQLHFHWHTRKNFN